MAVFSSSVVLSVGCNVSKLARRIQDTTEKRWPAVEPIVAYVNVDGSGNVTRRRHGDTKNICTLAGLSDPDDGTRYRENFDRLCGDLAGEIGQMLNSVFDDVRSQENLGEVTRRGLQDGQRIGIHLLSDSFGAVSSTFPLALVRVLEGGNEFRWGSLPVSVNCIYVLPSLFNFGEERRLARSHATFRELESYLKSSERNVSLDIRCWVIGSINRRSINVGDISKLGAPTAKFISRLIDGSLQASQRWDYDLNRLYDARMPLLASFGAAELRFPREYVRQLVVNRRRHKFCSRLTEGSDSDPSHMASHVRDWICQERLDELVSSVERIGVGSLVCPNILPETLNAGRYTRAVKETIESALESQRRMTERKTSELFQTHQKAFWDELDRILKEQGLSAARAFCDHLAGDGGRSERSVVQDAPSLESLCVDLHGRFAREAGLEEDIETERNGKTSDDDRLQSAARKRDDARARYNEESGRFRRTLAVRLGAIPSGMAILGFGVYGGIASQITAMGYSWSVAGTLGGAGFAAAWLFGLIVSVKRWKEYLAASGASVAALREVRRVAITVWERSEARLRTRLDLMIHEQAVGILRRLREEVKGESGRIERLQAQLTDYGEKARKAAEDAVMECSPYDRPALSTKQAVELVTNNKAMDLRIREHVDKISLPELVRSVREQSDDGLPPMITDAVVKIEECCDDILARTSVSSLIDQAPEPGGRLVTWLTDITMAAASLISINEGSPPPIVRRLWFAPSAATETLKTALKSASEEIEVYNVDDPDRISACELMLALPTHRIAELSSLDTDALDRHRKDVCAVPDATGSAVGTENTRD